MKKEQRTMHLVAIEVFLLHFIYLWIHYKKKKYNREESIRSIRSIRVLEALIHLS